MLTPGDNAIIKRGLEIKARYLPPSLFPIPEQPSLPTTGESELFTIHLHQAAQCE
jgi:hypothetical protein